MVTENMSEGPSKFKVCVIGGGAAGLCAAKHLADDLLSFKPVVYEQTQSIGGTWVYNENIGCDSYGLPIHSSMYQNLRTNLPGIIMNFPEFTKMGVDGTKGCISHEEVLQYLKDYAEHFELHKFVQLNTKVVSVEPEVNQQNGRTNWKVNILRLENQMTETHTFDAVIVCNGHYFEPYIPKIPGAETFKGKWLHSHCYRRPEEFSRQIVVVLGAASSGIDISVELRNYAQTVYLSHNNERLEGLDKSGVVQLPGMAKIDGNYIHFNDGKVIFVDTLIYCTGYKYNFPFLHKHCGITVDSNHVQPLYKHLINIEHPTMCIIGIPLTVVPFPLFHMQVRYFLALLKNKFHLPPKEDMLKEAKLNGGDKRYAHKLGDKQWEYNDSLAKEGEFTDLPAIYKNLYELWSLKRKSNLLNYKNCCVVVSPDGNSAEIVENSDDN